MARGSAKGNPIMPESHKALDALKYEIAAELGLPVGRNRSNAAGSGDTEFAAEFGAENGAGSRQEDYWGFIASRDAGAVGGRITRHLIRKAEQDLFGLANDFGP